MHKNRTISRNATLLETLKKMDTLDRKLLIVIDENKFEGLVSVGDIQRAIIQNKPLITLVKDVLRNNIRIAQKTDSFEDIKKTMLDFRMELCPVVNENNEIIKVYFWEDIFQGSKQMPKHKFNLPVVIMAGGLGTRLRPLTNVLPKALIPIGDKTMLEEIFDRFYFHGCNQFFISTNYKSEHIKFYLNSLELPYEIKIYKEVEPLGTAGSLSLLRRKIKETFFVSNCDILIEQDYSEVLDYHKENNNEITIVAALKNYSIPYGTLETGENGKLETFTEKPDLTFKINSGMYILEPSLLDEIPSGQLFHFTQLIEKVRDRGGSVGVYPVNEKSWKDIGEASLLKNYFESK